MQAQAQHIGSLNGGNSNGGGLASLRGGISPTLDNGTPAGKQPFAEHDKDTIEIRSTQLNRKTDATGATTAPDPQVDGPAGKLLALTENLTKIIQEENKMLEARRVRDIKSVQKEKSQLSQAYQKEMQRIRLDDKILGPKGSPIRSKIKDATQAFQDELIKHGKLLLRFKTITEGMVKAISTEVAKQKPIAQQYNALAGIAHSPSHRPQSIALNQVI